MTKPTTPALYEEVQRFTQWWIRIPMLFPTLLVVFGIYIRFVKGQPFGHVGAEPAPLWLDLLMFVLIGGVIPFLFSMMRLSIEVHANGLYYKFHTLHWNWHLIRFDEIKSATATKYSPLGDYGGWGIRFGPKGKCYNISGNEGVFLELHSGKNVLFGSQRMNELATVIQSRIQPK